MLRKGTELVDLPIIDLASGTKISQVKEIILNAQDDRLYGFICEEGKLLPFEAIENIGTDALVIRNLNIKEDLENIALPVSPPLFVPDYILGIPIITEKGDNLGKIGDININSQTGKIVSYEISDGLFKDLISGRSNIPINQVISYGEDIVLINDL